MCLLALCKADFVLKNEKDSQSEIEKAFDLFDTQNTGKISFADLKRIARELGENVTDQELHEMIKEADAGNPLCTVIRTLRCEYRCACFDCINRCCSVLCALHAETERW
jgi:hypothetical protein